MNRKPLEIDFSNKESIKNEIWWQMCDREVPCPVPLEEADLDNQYGWVYFRKYGIFHAKLGNHCMISGTIVAWEHGYDGLMDIPDELAAELTGISTTFPWMELQDWALDNLEGFALKSSVGKGKVYVKDEEAMRSDEWINFRRFGIVEI